MGKQHKKTYTVKYTSKGFWLVTFEHPVFGGTYGHATKDFRNYTDYVSRLIRDGYTLAN